MILTIENKVVSLYDESDIIIFKLDGVETVGIITNAHATVSGNEMIIYYDIMINRNSNDNVPYKLVHGINENYIIGRINLDKINKLVDTYNKYLEEKD